MYTCTVAVNVKRQRFSAKKKKKVCAFSTLPLHSAKSLIFQIAYQINLMETLSLSSEKECF